MQFTFEQLKTVTNAKIIINNTQNGSYSISTDTRTISNGCVYLPLKGETFDGEKFIQDAVSKGADGYFTTEPNNIIKNAKFGLLVKDTKEAYLQLANYYKRSIAPTTIAITGSSGKTTTKEIFSAIFEQNRKTHKSKLNHNNEIGLCQTLLSMPNDTEVLIVEMGMRGLGEIDLLAKYAQPDFAVITNIGTAHIGRLGSRENIAKAKCEIVNYMTENGVLITHPDELYSKALSNFTQKHIIIDKNDFKAVNMKKDYSEFEYKGANYKLYAGGEYNIQDALLGIETAILYGLTPQEIQDGLNNYKQIEKRFEEEQINGLNIINDSYNANPDSMKAAIKAFLELYDGEKALVLADMKELGENEAQYHKEIGEFLNSYKNIELITVGNLAKNISDATNHTSKNVCSNIEAAGLLKNLKKGTTVLLKGSRSMKLEEIIEEIKK